MNRLTAALLLTLTATGAQAGPILFNHSQNFLTVFADVDGTSDGPYDASSPPDSLPLTASANVMLPAGSALADAVADENFLAASTEATSVDGFASAVSVASFLGEFTTHGRGLSLHLDYDDFMDTLGDVDSSSQLFVLLQVDGVDLLNTQYSLSDLLDFSFFTDPGLLGTLDLTLVSTASAAAGGNGFNLASTSFSLNSVPEPASLALLLGGLGLLGAARSRAVHQTA